MNYWYERHGDMWDFCYKLDEEEQKRIDSIMPELIKAFKGERVSPNKVEEVEEKNEDSN